MALLCGSASVTFPSSSFPRHTHTNTSSSFLGLQFPLQNLSSLSLSSSSSSSNTKARTLRIHCQQEDSSPIPAPPEQDPRFLCVEPEPRFKGPDIWNKTWYPKAADHVNTEKTWYVVDATDKVLGRLASTIAIHIRGKNLETYTPSVDMGAFVIVVNAEKVAVSGKKRTQKLYRRHSGRPGGMTVETFAQLQNRIPERIIEHAVRGMLPKGRLGRRLFTHLKVYEGPDHPHAAQKPIELPIQDKRIHLQR
ncbi:60S ribosomal protein L13 [Stylosanthes scabra]|uniref:60S ribosomal protein L13 n=1 Tax=Stylosanthes scabra TaxID=79078 RepID=A0ABU6WPE7_9FABA|nr:60S ribosomal protein L13 [Stylosanthes scabra]